MSGYLATDSIEMQRSGIEFCRHVQPRSEITL